jgi:thiol-disulfide isomerase/thioredoxin
LSAAVSRRVVLIGGAGAALVAASPALALPAPRLGWVRLQRPADPYDPQAKPEPAIARARARAAKSGKLVLIDMGGNWCGDCLVLTAVMNLPMARAFIDQHFEVVAVDVGEFNKNLQIPARYHIQMKAVPCVVVLDGKGRVVNAGQELALGSAASLSPQAVLDQLAAWIPS